MVEHAAQAAARVSFLVLQSWMVQFDTLILGPGLLGLYGWQAVLRLLQKVKPAVLLKKTGDVVETLALLLSV